eukprot:COSAG01_NODE_802_length_13465_cov_24.092242_12_plen_59_part_00
MCADPGAPGVLVDVLLLLAADQLTNSIDSTSNSASLRDKVGCRLAHHRRSRSDKIQIQ